MPNEDTADADIGSNTTLALSKDNSQINVPPQVMPSSSNKKETDPNIDNSCVNTSASNDSCEVKRRTNAHGQVKTSRNCSRPKPPLPPMKEKKVTEPVCRSSRQQEIKEKEVNYCFYFLSIQYFLVFNISIR